MFSLFFQTVPKKKGRLFGLGRKAKSVATSSDIYVDPIIQEELKKKDARIEALETQNATILADLASQKSVVESTQRSNEDLVKNLRELFPGKF